MSRIYRARTISAFFAALIFLIVLLLCPTYCVQGIKNGLEYASGIIIPSLFPYIVLSGFIMRSGSDIIIGKLFSLVMKKFFYLPEVCAPCVIMSFIGGFPVGAKCTSLLYRQGRITARQARQLMDFCVCSGPAFLISAVGAVMLGNKSAGIILYISQIISGLIIGILVGIISRIKTAQDSQNTVISSSANSSGILSEILGSVSDGADSVIGMTSLILLFSMLESVIRNTGAYELMARLLSVSVADDRYAFIILPSLLEVTGGCCAVKDASLPLWCFALCTGFGGLCVHMQIFNICYEIPIKYGRYLLFRVFNALLSALVTYIICRVFSPTMYVFAAGGGDTAHISSGASAGSIALVFLSVIFVLTMHRGGPSGKKLLNKCQWLK